MLEAYFSKLKNFRTKPVFHDTSEKLIVYVSGNLGGVMKHRFCTEIFIPTKICFKFLS